MKEPVRSEDQRPLASDPLDGPQEVATFFLVKMLDQIKRHYGVDTLLSEYTIDLASLTQDIGVMSVILSSALDRGQVRIHPNLHPIEVSRRTQGPAPHVQDGLASLEALNELSYVEEGGKMREGLSQQFDSARHPLDAAA